MSEQTKALLGCAIVVVVLGGVGLGREIHRRATSDWGRAISYCQMVGKSEFSTAAFKGFSRKSQGNVEHMGGSEYVVSSWIKLVNYPSGEAARTPYRCTVDLESGFLEFRLQ